MPDTRRRKFVGPTTVYAFMQAMGSINDPVEGCVIGQGRARSQKFYPAGTLMFGTRRGWCYADIGITTNISR